MQTTQIPIVKIPDDQLGSFLTKAADATVQIPGEYDFQEGEVVNWNGGVVYGHAIVKSFQPPRNAHTIVTISHQSTHC